MVAHLVLSCFFHVGHVVRQIQLLCFPFGGGLSSTVVEHVVVYNGFS